MAKTTREILISAAQKLFGQTGITQTTINDIAVESKKGRRTLYTYFRNKNELIDAIIEEELQFIISSLERVMKLDTDPFTKLITYISVRMNTIRTAVKRNGSLQAEFFMDVIRVELVRRKLEKIEIKNLETILKEGIEKKVFPVLDTKKTAVVAHFVMRGLDIPYIRGILESVEDEKDETLKRVVQGILRV
jgi:AcrR family transcriptional regulator